MLAINNAAISIKNYPVSQEIGGKTALSIDIGDILPIPDKVGTQPLSEVLRGPALASPSVGLNKEVSDALKAFLPEKMEDPKFVRDFGALHEQLESGVNKLVQDNIKEQAEQGKPFDITGFSSSAVALIVAANVLLLSLNKADAELGNKLSLVSYDAAKSTAASMMREGVGLLSGSIAQGSLQLAITGAGATIQHKAQQAGVMNSSPLGNAVMNSSQSLGNIAGGSGQYAATLERSEQQTSQVNSRVATGASEESRESSRKYLSLIQELLRGMDSVHQSKNATIGAIAGNIRA